MQTQARCTSFPGLADVRVGGAHADMDAAADDVDMGISVDHIHEEAARRVLELANAEADAR